MKSMKKELDEFYDMLLEEIKEARKLVDMSDNEGITEEEIRRGKAVLKDVIKMIKVLKENSIKPDSLLSLLPLFMPKIYPKEEYLRAVQELTNTLILVAVQAGIIPSNSNSNGYEDLYR